LIHFDLDDRHQDELVVGSTISKRVFVPLSVILHALIVLLLFYGPELTFLKPDTAALEARQQELLRLQREREREARRFVFVQPQLDLEAKEPPPRAELSDKNRKAASPERQPDVSNPLPFARGNTTERIEAGPEERARGAETETPPNTEPPKPQPQEQIAKALPPADSGLRRDSEISRPAPGRLGDALRNLERYVQNQTFNNPQGGMDPGSALQFDTKGIEFGPWVRRFYIAVRRNWFIPNAAMTFRGHVVIQFNVHKSGQITDVQIVGPSSIEAFNRAAYQAIVGASPVDPLPADYPDPIMPIRATFFYNEQPPV
jgi:TonB family protein